jgi:uncharacterized protein (TIRG00374 family)
LKLRRVLLFLSPLVGLGVVGVVSVQTGASLGRVVRLVPLPIQLAALAAFLISLLGRGTRIALLTRALGGRLSLPGAVATQLTGEAAAAATPSRSGSDPARVLLLKKLGVDVPTAVAVLAGEIMSEGVVLGSLVLILLPLLPGHEAVILGALPYAVTSLAMPVTAFLLVQRPGSRTPPRVWRALKLNARHWRRLRAGAWRFRGKARALARLETSAIAGVLLASLAHVVARISVLPILASGVVPAAPMGPLVAWPLLLLYTGALLPPPGGGGAVEVTFVAALKPVLGVAPLAGTLLWWRFYTFYLGAFLGALILLLLVGKAGLSSGRPGRRGAASAIEVPLLPPEGGGSGRSR